MTANNASHLEQTGGRDRAAGTPRDDPSLTGDETTFYDAPVNNKRAIEVMGDEQLALFSVDENSIITRESIQIVRKNVSIDWTVKQSARARIRIVVKRILRKYGYPPDLREVATRTVLEQAELLAGDWAGQESIWTRIMSLFYRVFSKKKRGHCRRQ